MENRRQLLSYDYKKRQEKAFNVTSQIVRNLVKKFKRLGKCNSHATNDKSLGNHKKLHLRKHLNDPFVLVFRLEECQISWKQKVFLFSIIFVMKPNQCLTVIKYVTWKVLDTIEQYH